jgi:hypothetical protein
MLMLWGVGWNPPVLFRPRRWKIPAAIRMAQTTMAVNRAASEDFMF